VSTARLVWERTDGERVSFPLDGEAVVVGRDDGLTVRVDEPLVSRQHARLERRGEVWVVVDLIGVKNQGARARQCQEWGVNMVYLHYGADQRRADATRDSVQWLAETQEAVKIPIGVGTFGAEDAVRAVSMGAELVAIGHPVISGANPLEALKDYCQKVRAAYRPRKS